MAYPSRPVRSNPPVPLRRSFRRHSLADCTVPFRALFIKGREPRIRHVLLGLVAVVARHELRGSKIHVGPALSGLAAITTAWGWVAAVRIVGLQQPRFARHTPLQGSVSSTHQICMIAVMDCDGSMVWRLAIARSKIKVFRDPCDSGAAWTNLSSGDRAVAQIGCYMTDDEIEVLEAYASLIEITRTAVGALLIQQEMRSARLKRKQVGKSREAVSKAGKRRVTVHIGNAALKKAFTDHAQVLGFGSDEAALQLIRLEMKDRWLFKTFGFTGNHG